LQGAAAVGCRAEMIGEVKSRVTWLEAVGRGDGLLFHDDSGDVGFVEAIVQELRVLKFALGLTYKVIDLVRGTREMVYSITSTPRETMEIFRSPLSASKPPLAWMDSSTGGMGT